VNIALAGVFFQEDFLFLIQGGYCLIVGGIPATGQEKQAEQATA
jgi:hypothetical protein